jgi:VRR-NUC domain
LLLIRVSRPRECSSPSSKTTGAVDNLAVAGDRDSEEGERDRGRSWDKDRKRDGVGGRDRSRDRDRDGGRGREAGRDRKGLPDCLDIADILGYDWDVLIDAGDDSNEGQEGSTKSLDQGKKDQDEREGEADALIQNSAPSIAPYRDDSSSVKTKGRYNKWRKRKTQDADNDDLQSLGRTKRELADAGQLSSKASMKVPAVSIFHTLKRRHTESSVVVDISDDADIDADADEILLSESRSVTFPQMNNVLSEEDVLRSHTVGEDENACVDADSDPATEQAVHDRAPSPSLDRFVCTLADLILPLNDVSSSNQHSNQREGSAEDCSTSRHLPHSGSEQAVSGQVCNRGSVHEGWKYECMMVEVKGPTDSLADHQLMWLCVLSSSSVATFVAHVKETSPVD